MFVVSHDNAVAVTSSQEVNSKVRPSKPTPCKAEDGDD